MTDDQIIAIRLNAVRSFIDALKDCDTDEERSAVIGAHVVAHGTILAIVAYGMQGVLEPPADTDGTVFRFLAETANFMRDCVISVVADESGGRLN